MDSRRLHLGLYTPKPTYVCTLGKTNAVRSQSVMNITESLLMKVSQRLLILLLTCTPLGIGGWFAAARAGQDAAVSWFQD